MLLQEFLKYGILVLQIQNPGKGNSIFRRKSIMKRKKVLALLMATAVTFGSTVPTATFAMPEDQYTDVQKEDSFFEYVEDVTDYKIMAGLEDKTDEFGIAEKITRSDLVEYLYKMMLEPAANGSLRFEDVLDQDYEEAVVWADSVGLFEGLEDTFFENDEFKADTEVTREQAAVILRNLATKVLKIDFTSENEEDAIKDKDGNVLKALENLDAYEDGTSVTGEYLDAVKWAVGYTLLNPATTDTEADRYNEELAGKLNLQGTLEKVDLAEAISKLLDMVPEDSEVETAKTEYEDAQEAAASDNGSGYVGTSTGNAGRGTANRGNSNSSTSNNTSNNNSNNSSNNNSNTSNESVITPHEHTWEKNEWQEEGHYEQEVAKEAWTETIEHAEEGHNESVLVSPEESHTEEVVTIPEMGHREDVYHEEEGHYESVLVSPEEGHYEQVLVSEEEGHYEKVEVSPEEGHYEQVLVSEEEGHYEKVEVSPEEGHYETIHHEEEGHWEQKEVSPEKGHWETVHHEEEGHYETVHHEEEGHWETQQIQVGTEPVYETRAVTVCNLCDAILWDPATGGDFEEAITNHMIEHGTSISYRTENRQFQVGEKPIYEEKEVWVVDKEAWDEQVWVVDKEAWDEQVWVVDEEAVYEDVWVVDKEAYDEQVWVVDKEAVYEDQWVVDKEAVYEDKWVVDKEAVYEDKWVVDKEAYTEAIWVVDQEQVSEFIKVVDKEAVYEDKWIIDKEAWVEIIEHPAEYKDVWVVDKEAGFNWVCSGCGETATEI